MRHSLTLVLIWSLLVGTAAGARAQEAESAEYKEAVSLGLAEFDEKNFAEARVHFARAHQLRPSARSNRALGMVYFELKDYVQSVHFLNQALSSRERALEPAMRASTEKLLERALSYLARFELDIEPAVKVTVDGKASGLSAGSELVLAVGEHTLEFSAPGKISNKRSLQVEGGERETLRVRLQNLSADRPVASTGEQRPNDARPVYKNPWLWTAVGVVLAGAAAGTAIALTRSTDKTAEKPYAGTGGAPPLMGASLR